MKGGKKEMKGKRAQEGVIVTVVLVLVAIVAVSAIAYFIINQVRSGTSDAQAKADCLKLDFQITSAIDGGNSVTVQRNDDASIIVKTLSITLGGVNWGALENNPAALQAVDIPGTDGAVLSPGKVELGIILESGAVCPGIATASVTAAPAV